MRTPLGSTERLTSAFPDAVKDSSAVSNGSATARLIIGMSLRHGETYDSGRRRIAETEPRLKAR
jgi:hypothetical protein